MKETPLAPWLNSLPGQVDAAFQSGRWGDLPKWMDALEKMPDIAPSQIDLNTGNIQIGKSMDLGSVDQKQIKQLLMALHPWRKGPFDFFGIHIDTEWRSDFKWERLKNHIAPLKDRLILDVGCGNGYHCWRMTGEGARIVCGIDPTMLYVIQFHLMQKYIQKTNVSVFPIGVDDMPENFGFFDTVFSMGLLYHRRAPLDHLLQLKSYLRKGGELVLETLVIEGQEGEVICPNGRYAKMPNVWFLPSLKTLESWLKRMGFQNVCCVDVTKTTIEEQCSSEWMEFQSLEDFLDPHNKKLTIEGYPAPQRAIFLAQNH